MEEASLTKFIFKQFKPSTFEAIIKDPKEKVEDVYRIFLILYHVSSSIIIHCNNKLSFITYLKFFGIITSIPMMPLVLIKSITDPIHKGDIPDDADPLNSSNFIKYYKYFTRAGIDILSDREK